MMFSSIVYGEIVTCEATQTTLHGKLVNAEECNSFCFILEVSFDKIAIDITNLDFVSFKSL